MPIQEPDPDDHVFARKTADSYSKKFEGKFLDKESIGPELIARFMVMFFSIINDMSPEWIAMIVLACARTDPIPLASLTMSLRYATVDIGAFKTGAHAARDLAAFQAAYDHPQFNGNWSALTGEIRHMTEIFSICTRVLHGMFGFDGLIYDLRRDQPSRTGGLHSSPHNYSQ